MPRGAWARSDILAQYLGTLFGPSFSRKDCNGKKKIVVPCLNVILIAFFPRNIHWSSLFARKARVNTERVPPEHPINKFNIVVVSVKKVYFKCKKRQIRLTSLEPPMRQMVRDHPKCENLVVDYGRWSLKRIEPLAIWIYCKLRVRAVP